MKKLNKKDLIGYNGNSKVEAEHIFIPEVTGNKEGFRINTYSGCFFFSKEEAEKNANHSPNETGFYFIEIEYQGYTLYQHLASNVWN